VGNEPTIYTFKDKYANHYATDEPMIYRFRDKHVDHHATDEPTIDPLESSRSWVHLGGLAFFSITVDRGFIGGVMVTILVSKAVD
jgi:hypothetical protein